VGGRRAHLTSAPAEWKASGLEPSFMNFISPRQETLLLAPQARCFLLLLPMHYHPETQLAAGRKQSTDVEMKTTEQQYALRGRRRGWCGGGIKRRAAAAIKEGDMEEAPMMAWRVHHGALLTPTSALRCDCQSRLLACSQCQCAVPWWWCGLWVRRASLDCGLAFPSAAASPFLRFNALIIIKNLLLLAWHRTAPYHRTALLPQRIQ
jgi:hypothetical protein